MDIKSLNAMKAFKLNKYSKIEPGFQIPEGYFEQLENKIMKQLPQQEIKTVSLFLKTKFWVSAVAAVLIIALFATIYFEKSNSEIDTSEDYLTYYNIATEDLATYLTDEDIDNLETSLTVYNEEIVDFAEEKFIPLKKLQNMKKYNVILMLLVCCVCFGQNNKKLNRIKSLKVAYLSEKLDLSVEEAEKFWPVYNEFERKQFELRKEKRQLMNQLKSENNAAVSNKEMDKLLEKSEALENAIQSNRKFFVKNIREIISPQKVLLLKLLEEDFKKELLKQIRNNRKKRN